MKNVIQLYNDKGEAVGSIGELIRRAEEARIQSRRRPMRWEKMCSTSSPTSSTSPLLVKYCQVSKVCIICKYVNLLKLSFLINLSMNDYFSVGAEVVSPLGVPEPQGF